MKGRVNMRLVPINCIKEGSFLAKTIYDTNGRILLAKDFKLTKAVLKKIEQNGIISLYINDGYSDNEIEDNVKPELRQRAIKTIKNNFDCLVKYSRDGSGGNNRNKDIKTRYQCLDEITKVASEIIEELLSQKNVLINLVDIKSMDNYTYEHSINVTILALILGIELGYDKKRLLDLAVGAMLHDMGKVFMPGEILQKNGKLSENEFAIVKQHPVDGYEYVRNGFDISILSRNIILQHHEKVDGTGYPDGFKGEKLHDYVKIVTIADVYDALTSDRPYRRAMSPNEAMEYLMGTADRHFDYKMVCKFIKKIVPYPEGTLVRLSNGCIGVVKNTNPEAPLRPYVKVVRGVNGIDNNLYIDLMKENNIVIECIQYDVTGLSS